MSNEVAFANWWEKEMKGIPCPPVPRKLSELNLTAQMAMQATHPQLYTALLQARKRLCGCPPMCLSVCSQDSCSPVMLVRCALLGLKSKLNSVSGLVLLLKISGWLSKLRALVRCTRKNVNAMPVTTKWDCLSVLGMRL